jgi:hypothetical protein
VIAALRRIPPLEGALFAVAVALLIGVGVLKQGANAPPALDSYSSFDTASGGYRAFYDLLAREGVRVDRFEQRPAFLERGGTLVFAEPLPFDPGQVAQTSGDAAALEAWVRAGGRLLYLGHDDAAAAAGILHLPRSLAGRPGRSRAVAPPGVGDPKPATALRWRVARGERVLVADGRGAIVVTYPFGHGRVTAVIDESLLQNSNIGLGDRARLGYALAVASAGPASAGPVLFDEAVHGHVVPLHWWSIVPRPFLIALAVAAAALLVAFAGAAVRFGPPLLPVERADRTSADFIDALSSLLARGGAIRKALTDAAGSATRTVARGLGLDDGASRESIGARIEREDLRAAFFEMLAVAENGFPDERNLVRGVALAQRLRKEYAPHGRSRY